MIDYDAVIKKVDKYAKENMKSSRYEHSLRVANMCVLLCKRYGLDEQKGYLAGIGHDICKYLSDVEMLKKAEQYDLPITDYERKSPGLLHGRAAAVVLRDKFLIDDADILEAVACHVCGTITMCDLAKILFISDKAEPARPHSTDEYRENLLKLSLNGIMYKVVSDSNEYLRKRGYEIYPDTLKMQEYYKLNK